MTEERIIEFRQLRKQKRNPFGTEEVLKVDQVVNKEIVIEDFEVDKGTNFDVTYILAYVDGRKVTVSTTSRVIEKQLMQVKDVLKQGAKIKAKVVRRKRYYALE